MTYSEAANLVADDDRSALADLCDPTETFECRYCGKDFEADADCYGHYRKYGCGCVPECITDVAIESHGIKPSAIKTWRVEDRPGIRCEQVARNWCGCVIQPERMHAWTVYQDAVIINGRSKIVDQVRLDSWFDRKVTYTVGGSNGN